MNNKRWAKNFWIIFGIGVVLLLFGYAFVAHHRDTPDQIRQHRNALLRSGPGAPDGTKAASQKNSAASETRREPVSVAAAAPAEVNGKHVYESVCVACHGAGIAGAPKMGDGGLWAKRIAKGVDALYASAINGVQGSAGVMPPKGGNTALSIAEVKAAVDYIVAQSK
ncbi:MAG: cytochrome c5 family protein [Burkholderiales bacterium]|nr:cytochrome c5 family protein [Burkholderiales bacterium]